MLGNKITRKSISDAYRHVKHHIGHAYRQTKNFLGDVDKGVKYGKLIYNTISPVRHEV